MGSEFKIMLIGSRALVVSSRSPQTEQLQPCCDKCWLRAAGWRALRLKKESAFPFFFVLGHRGRNRQSSPGSILALNAPFVNQANSPPLARPILPMFVYCACAAGGLYVPEAVRLFKTGKCIFDGPQTRQKKNSFIFHQKEAFSYHFLGSL